MLDLKYTTYDPSYTISGVWCRSGGESAEIIEELAAVKTADSDTKSACAD